MLSSAEIDRVVAVLSARATDDATRQLLFAGVDPAIMPGIKRMSRPSDQIRADLCELLEFQLDPKLEPPLAAYLQNAASLLRPRMEAQEILYLAERVRGGRATALLLNPRKPAQLESQYAHALKVPVDGPGGAWQKTELPGSHAWREARQGIDSAVSTLSGKRGDILVYASTGYAMGAYLGNRVADVAGRHSTFFQLFRSTWVDFGPGAHEAPRAPGDLSSPLDLSSCSEPDIALIFEITRPAEMKEVRHGLEQANADHARVATIAHPRRGQQALSSRADIDRAAADVEHLIETARANRSVRSVHLFFIGPVALLMRAARRFHQPRTRLVIHERGPGDLFRPALEFGEGTIKLLSAHQ